MAETKLKNQAIATTTLRSLSDQDSTGGSSTTSSTYANITGADVSITLTETSNILLLANVQAYAATAAHYAIQWHDGTNLIGTEIYIQTVAGNGRVSIHNNTVVANAAAGTKTYTLKHRSNDNTTSITAETINCIAISMPA